jgi:hypothetical protein
MKRMFAAATWILMLSAVPVCSAQQSEGFISRWLSMVSDTQSEQPHWITPLATVTPRLEQEFRFDTLRQLPATGDPLWNIDGGKGLEVIPQRYIEVLFNLPPYLIHNNPRVKDGFGDVSFLMKFRALAANEEHGNYILTFFLGGSIPTGSYKNGSEAAIVTPTIAGGKGWGRFDFQSTLGAGFPVTNENTIGHAIAWNTAFQYHVQRFFWPEVETNATFFKGGTNDGNKQLFLMPGLVVGRIPIHNRVGLTLGAGAQIAATHFHTFNHGLILTARMPF